MIGRATPTGTGTSTAAMALLSSVRQPADQRSQQCDLQRAGCIARGPHCRP
jgi:hypothetical protein